MPLFRLMYSGELSHADRAALSHAGFAHRGDTIVPASAGYGGQHEVEGTTTHLVDVNAGSIDEARRRLIDTLGREPPELLVEPLTEA